MSRIVVGVTGASGIILAYRAIDALTRLGHSIELVMTKDAHITCLEEMGEGYAGMQFTKNLSAEQQKLIQQYQSHDFTAKIASGSYQVYGMLIIPCSMASLAAISCGLADNLLRRAADVTLKEKRPLVIVPREAPLSEIHLENMLRLARYGAVIVPPVPAWYTRPTCLEDIENFIVSKALDALKIEIDESLWKGSPRWSGSCYKD